MTCDPLFEHLMQELFPRYYVEALDLGPDSIVNYKPEGPLTKNLLSMFPRVIVVLEHLIMESWSECLCRNSELMISSLEMYVSHMMVISTIEVRIVNDIYDKFFMMLTSVTYIAEWIDIATGMNFYKLTPRILTVFFENFLRENFSEVDGWKYLEKHILDKKYNEYYEECVALNFAIDEVLGQKMREIISPQRPFFSFGTPLNEAIRHPVIVNLTYQLMSSVETSLLNELGWFKLHEKQANSIQGNETGSAHTSETDSAHAYVVMLKRVIIKGSDSGLKDCGSVDSTELDCVSSLEKFEEKIRLLISVFELLDTN